MSLTCIQSRMGQCLLVCIPAFALRQRGSAVKMLRREKMFNLSCLQDVKEPHAYIAVQEDHKNFHQGELVLFENNFFILLRAKKDNMPKLHLRSIYRNTVALCPLFFPTTP